jgi:hypothetical protein
LYVANGYYTFLKIGLSHKGHKLNLGRILQGLSNIHYNVWKMGSW